MFQPYRERYPLINRIVAYTFFFAIFVSLLMLAGQIYISYTLGNQRIESFLQKLEDTQLDTLINNVWSLDQGAIDIQLKSILEDPDIVYIWLQYEPDSENIQFFGVKPEQDKQILTKEYDLLRETTDTQRVKIGRVGFVATTENISKRLLLESSGNLLGNLITIIVTCLFMLFLFVTIYSRHINRIVNYTEKLDIGGLDHELVLKRSRRDLHAVDEINRIVDALNSMRKRVKSGVQAQYLAKKELTQEKLFSDAVINSMPGIFFVLDENLNLVRLNNSFIDFLGSLDTVTVKYDFFSCIPAERKEELQEMLELLLTNKEPMAKEIDLASVSGRTNIPYLLSIQFLEIEQTKYLIGIGTDLTDRKRMESQLRQSQKMEALGTLAGGISHDFNNILSAIVGYTSLAKIEYKGDGKLRKYLETIEEASERAKALVQQILAFSRKTEIVKEPVEIAEIVSEALTLLRSSLPATIEIRERIDSNLFAVVDPTEIHQVIMNLCTNSYHAMQEDGGVLSVSLSQCVVTDDNCSPEIAIAQGTYLTLEISDTGKGMDKEIQSKIFEPYFTTKGTGAGTGLGLSVVHGVVSSYKGYIYVYSVPQKGTSFTIYLPAVSDAEITVSHQAQKSEDADVQGRNESIIVVDDEKFILDFCQDMLTRYGYRVSCFINSTEALAHFEKNSLDYDLVIVDQVMPHMQGDKLAAGMWEVRSDIPVILCSGFPGSLGRREFVKKGFSAYVQKPVNGFVLLQAVRDALGARNRA